MKVILAIELALLMGISLSLRAQTETGALVPPDARPQLATYYSVNWPPLPYDWAPDLPVYSLGNGSFLIDDSSCPGAWGATSLQGGAEGALSMGDSGDSTNSSGGGNSSYDASFSTNGLWLEITGITNGTIFLALNNATDMVYEIWSTEALTNSLTNWNIEQEVWPVTNQTWTPFTVEVQDRTNSLFFGARDWTGITSYGNLTIPEWWFWENFGTVDLSETNWDYSYGNTLLYDYQNGINPNAIYFALNVTNQDFNTSSASVQITVSDGVPYYLAVLVDSSDYSTANWTVFNNLSNLVVNLGSVEGWHTVSVGLKSFAPNAQQTWDPIQLKLVLTPPVLIVTNPIVGTVTQPVIQLQGYCSDNLACMSYDLSNSATFETNQQAFVTTRQYDTNNLEYTTNGFQCFNIPLAKGTNTITLHATDSAGNVTATNLLYVLDPTANTNPPVINLSWPQNNTSISGTAFPVRGIVNDPFATVSAQVVNGGGTSNLTGLVEQNGSFWIENVPLGNGTNYLTITATNTAGYGSATNIVVAQSPIILTISSVSFNEPMSPTATVNGTLSGSSDIVLVNGIEATNNGDGTWTAYYVPVGDSGTATISADATANGVPSGADAQMAEDVVRGPEVALADFNWNYATQKVLPVCIEQVGSPGIVLARGTESYIINYQTHWSYGSSGYNIYNYCHDEDYDWPPYDPFCTTTYQLETWDATGNGTSLSIILDSGYEGFSGTTNSGSGYMDPAQYLPDFSENANWQTTYYDYGVEPVNFQYLDQQRYVLKTGGQAVPGQQNLWVIWASANDDPVSWRSDNPGPAIPPNQITVAGQALDTNGCVYLALPNNSTPVDVTPMASGNYTFSGPCATEYQAQIQANGITLDPIKTNATFCVGQQIKFTLIFSLIFSTGHAGSLSFTNVLCNWTFQGNYVNSIIPNPPESPIYTTNGPIVTTNGPCTNWYFNGPGGTVNVGANLILPNGKSLSFAALGRFAVVAPAIDGFVVNPLQVLFYTNNGASVSAPVNFQTYVLPPYNFSGTATYAQLVLSSDSYYTSVYGLPVHNGESTGGNYWLDNNYPYAADTPQYVSWDDDPVKYVAHGDTPGLEQGNFPFVNYLSITNLFRTYLQFQPTGGIPVTIGRIDWGWSCIATESNGIWSWTLTTNQPVPNWNDSTFPLWTNVFHNN
jgi:hypothetical protein